MLAPGEAIGSYTIVREIGAGAMGAVYEARHRWLGRSAAIKVLHDDLHLVRAVRERLLSEARIVAGLRHPNIVEVLDAGEHEGRPYLAMELLQGESLADRLARGRMSPFETVHILRQVCAALSAAHARGVVHRDLKPDNIFLAGRVAKVLDWGVALSSRVGRRLTFEGALVGTPEYMAPEQCCSGEVDARTDVYALGVVAWEMFLEDVPFSGETSVDILSKHIARTPERPSSLWPFIPAELEMLLLGMLAKRPDARPTLRHVLLVLDRVEIELEARRSGVIELRRRKRPGRPRPPARSGAFVGFVAAAVIASASLLAIVGSPIPLEPQAVTRTSSPPPTQATAPPPR